jgi:hypothetical protein
MNAQKAAALLSQLRWLYENDEPVWAMNYYGRIL